MKKRKLKLDELTVKSFVIDIDGHSKNTIKGGTLPIVTIPIVVDASIVLKTLTISATAATISVTLKEALKKEYHPHPGPKPNPGDPHPDRISKVQTCDCPSYKDAGSCFPGYCPVPNQN